MQSPALSRWLDVLRTRFRESSEFTVDDLFREFPESKSRPTDTVELIYEDYCLRRESGIDVSAKEFLHRYSPWKSKLEVVFECDRVFNDTSDVRFPEPGDQFGEFDLHQELGRGAKGRVYLATQPLLSDRPVVLKIASRSGSEHLSLARLQHAAIVPLLFAQDEVKEGLRLLCMPYLGGCTLEDAMRAIASIDVEARSGRDIADAIEQERLRIVDPLANDTLDLPAMRFLKSASYEQAVCWIISCLAEGLHYAHQRGLGHFDVKPSNVLLASDGQPMLLDFHLARDLSQHSDDTIDTLGGTPGYMAPEHRRAFDLVRQGTVAPARLDHRADIYSLGLMMHDLLSGAMPPSVDTIEESPRRGDFSTIRPAKFGLRKVHSILSRCLEVEPEKRYSDAGECGAALRRIAIDHKDEMSVGTLLLGVVLGASVSAAVFFGIQPLLRSVELTVPSTVVVTSDASEQRVADELHTMLSNARSSNILETGTESELRRLHDTCSRLWEERDRLSDAHRIAIRDRRVGAIAKRHARLGYAFQPAARSACR